LFLTGSAKGEEGKMEVSEALEDKIFHSVWDTDYIQQK
jgi:hypothetical protein